MPQGRQTFTFRDPDIFVTVDGICDNVQDGQLVTFAEVDGMPTLNDKTPRRIKNVKVSRASMQRKPCFLCLLSTLPCLSCTLMPGVCEHAFVGARVTS